MLRTASTHQSILRGLVLFMALVVFRAPLAIAETSPFRVFTAAQEGAPEVWRITDDPTMRDWANYHNTDAWSPDGRYLCWEHWAWLTTPDFRADRGGQSQVYVFDMQTKQAKLLGKGSQPRWASKHNWLFFVQNNRDIIWYDADTGERRTLTSGVMHIGGADADDRWLYGSTKRIRDRGPKGSIVRIALEAGAQAEVLPEARGNFYLPNPVHPRVLFRVDGLLADNERGPFAPLHVMTDLDGGNEQVLSTELFHRHQTWSGDGQWFLSGNGQMCGRKWDEPFPGNRHYLANITCGDISACGRSGRWIVGSNNIGSMQIADLRSGDARVYLRALSFVHYFGDRHANAMGDNDSKGSPDGTKVVFMTNYDLEKSPHTKIAEDMPSADADRIVVASTEGFPASGRLSVQAEIIGYRRKTPTAFEGLTREMYGVRAENPGTLSYFPPALFKHYTENRLQLKKGLIVTSFDARLIPVQDHEQMIAPNSPALPEGWRENPVTWQRRSDVHVAVVRKPDRPYIRYAPRGAAALLQLIPGENHREIAGYDVYKDGQKLNDELLQPGAIIELGAAAGGYAHLYVQAVAVEWSGLRSEKSMTITPTGKPSLEILADKPDDFSWTYDRWTLEGGTEITADRARAAGGYIKEIVHVYEGIIAREWYSDNVLVHRDDLNHLGQATRRLYYQDGRLSRREYWTRDEQIVSVEYFDSEGYITEAKSWAHHLYLNDMDLAKPYLENHWFFDRGMPVKLIGSESYERFTSFPGVYLKQGDTWTCVKTLPAPPVILK